MTKLTVLSRSLSAIAIALLGLVGAAPAVAGSAPLPAAHQVADAPCGDTSGFTEVGLSTLPAEADDTVDLIQQGGPYPHEQDGTTFQNREELLPLCSTGYYAEFTVPTPGLDHRGARRIVTGDGGEYFYTSDHYESFVLVDING